MSIETESLKNWILWAKILAEKNQNPTKKNWLFGARRDFFSGERSVASPTA